MAGFRIEGDTSGTVAEVNTDKELLVGLNKTVAKAGFVALASELDPGVVTGSRLVRAAQVTPEGRLRVSADTAAFSEFFPGAALNSALWTAPVTTATVTVATGFVNLNAGLSTASGAVARVSSYRSFPVYGAFMLYIDIVAQFAQAPVASNVVELGLGIATGTAAPTDGAFFRINASGELRGVINYNGVESQTDPISFATYVGANTSRRFEININQDRAEFWIDDVLVGVLVRPTAGFALVASANLPVLLRTYNTGVTASAQVVRVSHVNVQLAGMGSPKLWPHIRAGAGDMGVQGPTGGTMGTTALYGNSLAAGAGAAATNTTAALGVGLGGQFSLQPTLAAGTDGIISSYQVPLGTAALPGKSLYITGVRIHGVVTAALTGGPVIGAWSLAFGHTAVSLATAEAATTKAARRVPLGIQTFAATAVVGTRDDREISVKFDTPIVVQPGEFVQTVLKNLGTVTSAGVITFLIAFDAYWE